MGEEAHHLHPSSGPAPSHTLRSQCPMEEAANEVCYVPSSPPPRLYGGHWDVLAQDLGRNSDGHVDQVGSSCMQGSRHQA